MKCETKMDKNDLAALELALEQSLADPYRAEQVNQMLQERDRIEVAKFCSYSRQCNTLKLHPWQWPPSWLDADPDEVLATTSSQREAEREAAALLLRMREFGISKWHPDPRSAIDAACEKIRRRNRRRG